jgi:hypothetical protein
MEINTQMNLLLTSDPFENSIKNGINDNDVKFNGILKLLEKVLNSDEALILQDQFKATDEITLMDIDEESKEIEIKKKKEPIMAQPEESIINEILVPSKYGIANSKNICRKRSKIEKQEIILPLGDINEKKREIVQETSLFGLKNAIGIIQTDSTGLLVKNTISTAANRENETAIKDPLQNLGNKQEPLRIGNRTNNKTQRSQKNSTPGNSKIMLSLENQIVTKQAIEKEADIKGFQNRPNTIKTISRNILNEEDKKIKEDIDIQTIGEKNETKKENNQVSSLHVLKGSLETIQTHSSGGTKKNLEIYLDRVNSSLIEILENGWITEPVKISTNRVPNDIKTNEKNKIINNLSFFVTESEKEKIYETTKDQIDLIGGDIQEESNDLIKSDKNIFHEHENKDTEKFEQIKSPFFHTDQGSNHKDEMVKTLDLNDTNNGIQQNSGIIEQQKKILY